MNEVLKVILSMSLSGGIVVIVLFFVLFLSGKRLSRQWQYYIWLIAIIRLLVPFAPPQNLMNVLFQSVQSEQSQTSNNGTEAGQARGAEEEIINMSYQVADDEILNETMTQSADKAAGGKAIVKKQYVLLNVAWQYLWLVWILPAFILLIRKITVYTST